MNRAGQSVPGSEELSGFGGSSLGGNAAPGKVSPKGVRPETDPGQPARSTPPLGPSPSGDGRLPPVQSSDEGVDSAELPPALPSVRAEPDWDRMRALIACPPRCVECLWESGWFAEVFREGLPLSLLVLAGHRALGNRGIVVGGPGASRLEGKAASKSLVQRLILDCAFSAAKPEEIPSLWETGSNQRPELGACWRPYAHLPGAAAVGWLAEQGKVRDVAWLLIGSVPVPELVRALAGGLGSDTVLLGLLEPDGLQPERTEAGAIVRSLLESVVRGRAEGEWAWESCGDLVAATVHCLAWGLHWEGLAWEHGQVDSGAGAAAVPDPTWAAGVFLDPPVGRLLTAEERWVALRLARHALDSVVRTGRLPEVKPAELPVALLARRACFVTLTKHGQLRGCIGHLTAQMPLYQAIMENARAAALQDYRFEPVRPSELPEIDIEISVLTPPRPLQYKSPEELLQRLRPGIDGVILELGPCSATFLPQVWEKLPSKEQFLDQLCLKAGCWPGDWRRPSVSVSTYQVEAFAEDDRPAVDGPVVAPQP